MKEKIIAVVVDHKLLTLYRPDASTIEIPQGDPRVRGIIDAVLPIVNNGGVAEVDLTMTNTYQEFEKKTNGLIRFFKVAKKAVAHIFGKDDEPAVEPIMPGEFGHVPNQKDAQTKAAVDEILAGAIPSSDQNFDTSRQESNEDTIVAVVETKSGPVIVPEAEKLKDHINYSAGKGSTKGMEAFYSRIAKVIDGRGHSVQDVLRFLERADLPIADDGTIVAYKLLNRRHGPGGNDYYVDCHTGNVRQVVGSYVCVDEALVDRNRRNECSNGLHVARRGYLGGFGGDVCVLIKVAPEDVVTVPHGDANKVRVCGYHILFELPSEAMHKLKQNRPMTNNPEAARLLSRAISGDHPRRMEMVKIGGQRGSNITVTKLARDGQVAKPTGKIEQHSAFDDSTNSPMSVNPTDVSKQVADEVAKAPPAPEPTPEPIAETPKPTASDVASATASAQQLVEKIVGEPTRQQKVQTLWNVVMTGLDRAHVVKAAEEIKAIKKAAKVNWEKLGLSDAQVQNLNDLIMEGIAVPESMLDLDEKTAPTPQPEADGISEDAPAEPEKKVSTNQTEARRLFTEKKYDELYAFKRAKKKSWEALGFDSLEIDEIMLHKAKG